MRILRLGILFSACVVLLLADLASAGAQSLPACAKECMLELVPQSSCTLANQTCICTNVELKEQMNVCILANCTVKEGLTTLNVTDTTCGAPDRDRTSISILVPAVGLCFLFFVALRLYTRLVITKLKMGLDDWATIFLACCAVPVNSGSVLLGKAGLGKDIWTLEFKNITRILYLFYIQEILYATCVALIKICFLLFYLRIFPNDRMRHVIKASCIITACWGITFIFAFAFQCTPISYNWTSWDGEHHGSCVKTNALVVTAAGLNIVLDAWVIALPIPKVMKLQASVSTKLQVTFMFSVGFLITGVGIYRAIMVKIFATSTNATWDMAAGGYWSVIEIDVGIFCLCLPALRSLLGRLFPSVFGSTKEASSMGLPSSQKKIRTDIRDANTSFVQLIVMDPNCGLKSDPDIH